MLPSEQTRLSATELPWVTMKLLSSAFLMSWRVKYRPLFFTFITASQQLLRLYNSLNPAIIFSKGETNPQIKTSLRETVSVYMERAEKIKEFLIKSPEYQDPSSIPSPQSIMQPSVTIQRPTAATPLQTPLLPTPSFSPAPIPIPASTSMWDPFGSQPSMPMTENITLFDSPISLPSEELAVNTEGDSTPKPSMAAPPLLWRSCVKLNSFVSFAI